MGDLTLSISTFWGSLIGLGIGDVVSKVIYSDSNEQ